MPHGQTIKSTPQIVSLTTDKIIRQALREKIDQIYSNKKVIEELGISHGIARIDIAVINGLMHGYEIKSDCDTLNRLPEQMAEYNAVFDKITLVVGKRHLHHAIKIIPDWWGIMLAKINSDNQVIICEIRPAGKNLNQDKIAIARLLWRAKALQILEERNQADGVRSKPREFVYQRLGQSLSINELKKQVRETLRIARVWQSDALPVSNGG